MKNKGNAIRFTTSCGALYFNLGCSGYVYGIPHFSDQLFMNGSEIFNFTIEAVPPMIEDTLAKNALTRNDVDGYVFHQANKFMINFLRKMIKIESEKFHMYMSDIGNTVSNTIRILLN